MKFHHFKSPVSEIQPPERFNFPFFYEPHPLCLLAADELQNYISTQKWTHNFGIDKNKSGEPIGKMFGVLIVENDKNEIGYLAAFSGKLSGDNDISFFVPHVFDRYYEVEFFRIGEAELIEINEKVEKLSNDPYLIQLKTELTEKKKQAEITIEAEKLKLQKAKADRRINRRQLEASLTTEEFEEAEKRMNIESQNYSRSFKRLKKELKKELVDLEKTVSEKTVVISSLKNQRKKKSNEIQKALFESYDFLNISGESKNLLDIFQERFENIPPAGAGDCAAPKLLQYAFQKKLKPIAIAEFWWGESPNSVIRKHGNFYPACRGKCEPILGHMLLGIEMDENPMLTNPAEGKKIEIVHEDDALLVINKPAEFLSVPGKNIQDSVWLRMKQRMPYATGPLIVHRLDMSTSGLLLIAKTKEAHKFLQKQFLDRTIKKRYVALLEGELNDKNGIINLPIRVDLDNRPQQMVCEQHGKPSRTKWTLLDSKNGKTRVHFYPITGRTHQLRIHAAHPLGLNCPIVGDNLYGKRDKRLCLHAEWLEFEHPTTKRRLNFKVEPDF